MTPEGRGHFQRADELVQVARELADSGHAADSVSRSYYAMFHAATAALLALGIERSSHRGIIAAFGESLVKGGHMDARHHAAFRKAFDARIESDYLPEPAETIEKARAILDEAREFIVACRSFLQTR